MNLESAQPLSSQSISFSQSTDTYSIALLFIHALLAHSSNSKSGISAGQRILVEISSHGIGVNQRSQIETHLNSRLEFEGSPVLEGASLMGAFVS